MTTKSQIFSEINLMMNNGAPASQAISVVSEKYNLNPNVIYNYFYKKYDKNVDNKDKRDIHIGDIVTLKADSLENHYEVININNNNEFVLQNADDNTQITASESEITPVIMENNMNKKLNEAQYNISINGLETEDADTLSQMLSLASQAENSVNTDPMTMNPVDMENPMNLGMPSSILDDSGDDIQFDEELPMDAEIPSTDMNTEMPSDDMGMNDEIPTEMDSYEEIPSEEVEMPTDDMNIDEDLVLDKSQADPTEVAQEESFDMDTTLDNDLENQIRESLLAAGINLEESIDSTPQQDFAEDITDAEQDENADELMNEDISDTITREVKINESDNWFMDDEENEPYEYTDVDEFMADYFYDNAALQSEYDNDLLDEYKNEIFAKWKELLADGKDEWRAAEIAANEVLPNSDYKETAKKWDTQHLWDDNLDETKNVDDEDILDKLAEFEGFQKAFESGDYDEMNDLIDEFKEIHKNDDKIQQLDNDEIIEKYNDFVMPMDDLDETINSILKNAGVQINEADDEVADNTNVGEPVTDESLYVNENADEQGNEPDYHNVDTTTFGKDASEGIKENPLTMTFESTVNKDKIKSIYETAKSMYKKYDSSDWLKLDRRYIEKLILEGVGYTTASKMLLDAKKGK